jgi:hypothetical protein
MIYEVKKNIKGVRRVIEGKEITFIGQFLQDFLTTLNG